MTEMFDHMCDYLTWHPEVLARTGLTILAVSAFTCLILLCSI